MGVFDDLIPGGEPSSSTGGAFDDLVPKVKQNKGIAGDLVTDVKRGIQQIPGIATGLLDIPIGAATGEAYAGKAADALGDITGFKPSQWAKDAEAEYSPGRQAASRNVNQAWEDNATPFADAADGDLRGIGQIAKAYIQNPQHTLGSVVESLPSMVAGGVVGRGLAAGSKLVSPVIGAGIGEGAVMAGQQMDQLTEAGVDGRTAAGASALTGIAGGAIGVGGGKIAQALGVVDPETAIAGGATRAIADEVQDKTIKGAIKEGAKRVAGGAMSEGFFEELPQSVLEQALSNLAQGKPWDEGVSRAAVEGTLAGAAMGGAFNAMPGKQAEPTSKPPAAEAQEEQKPTLALPAPTYTGTPGDQIIAGDVDRQAAIDKAQAESDAIWAARDEYERQQAEYRKQPMPTIINDPEPIQQRIDALMGINESRLQGFARSNYEKALENAFNEQVGWVVGKDDKEIPFTMGDYLKSKVAAADIDRKRQAAQPAPAAAPQPVIPVVGPLSAAANVAVQTGAHANTIMQQTAAMAQQQAGIPNGDGITADPPAPNTGAQAPNIAQPAPNTQPQGEGGTPATAQQDRPAAASPAGGEFDVSKRTEQQLTYLALKGKPGWKEAAVAEIARRAGAAAQEKQTSIPNGDGVTSNPPTNGNQTTQTTLTAEAGMQKRESTTFAGATVEDSNGEKLDGFRAEFDNNKGGKGYIELAVDGDRIYPTMVDNGLFRPTDSSGGAVAKIYEQAIAFAEENGKAFTSDSSVTVPAARLYDSLSRKGYTVQKNPAARLATSPEVITDRWVTDDGSPVFAVSKQQTKSGQQAAAGIPAATAGGARSAPAATKRNAFGLPEGYTFATGKNSREKVSASSIREGDVIHVDGRIVGVDKVTQKADGTVDLLLDSVGGKSTYNVSADRQLERRKIVKIDNSSQADSSPVAVNADEDNNAPTYGGKYDQVFKGKVPNGFSLVGKNTDGKNVYEAGGIRVVEDGEYFVRELAHKPKQDRYAEFKTAEEISKERGDVSPTNEGDTKQATEQKAEKPLKSPTEGGPEDSIGWTSMTTVQREGLLHRAGYSTKDMKLNIGGKGLLNRAWENMGKSAREKLIAAHETQFNQAPDQQTAGQPGADTVTAPAQAEASPVSQQKTDAAPEAKQEAAPAITPQHVENGKAEPATDSVVAQSLKKGAANSPLDLRQERDLLLKKIDAAIAEAPTAAEKGAWDNVNQKIDLKNNMHVEDTIGYRGFEVPGDGKFKVLNLKEALQRFRDRVEANPGFKKPVNTTGLQKVAPWQRTTSGGSESTIMDLLESGEYSAAVEYAKQIGKPLVFGQYQDGSAITVYTDAKPFEREGYDDFNMVSVRNPQGADKMAWAVIDLNSGLTVSSKHPTRLKAIAETNKALEKTTPAQMATAVRSVKANTPGIVGTQEELEQRWLEKVEGREAEAQAKAEQEHRSKMRGATKGMLAETSVGKDAPASPVATAVESPAVDLKGFERVPLGNGAFELRDGNMVVKVEPTTKGKYQASFRSAKSSPHLIGEQGAVDWAASYRTDATTKPADNGSPANKAEGSGRSPRERGADDFAAGRERVIPDDLSNDQAIEYNRGYAEAKNESDYLKSREGKEVVVLPSEFPLSEVDASYSHISHSGTGRARSDRDAFVETVNGLYDEAMAKAETDEQKAAAKQAAIAFKDEYLRRLQPVIRVRGQTYSGFVAGRAKLNANQANSRNDALSRALDSFAAWQRGAEPQIMQAVLDARNDDQRAAERKGKEEKAAKKKAELHALLGKLMDFKKGDDVRFGNYPVAKVSLDKAGYPSSVMVDATDLTDNKFDIAKMLFDGDKDKLRAAVDEIRAGQSGAEQAAPKRDLRKVKPPKIETAKEMVKSLKSAGYPNIVELAPRPGRHELRVQVNHDSPFAQYRFMVDLEKRGAEAWEIPGYSVPDFTTEAEAEAMAKFRKDLAALNAGEWPASEAAPVAEVAQDAKTAAEPQPVAPADAGSLSLVERHNADIAKLFDGELSVDELKAAFALVRDNRSAIEAELSKFKKDELLRSGGAMFGYRYKSETKPEIVKAAYAAMLDNFIMGEPISYALGGGGDWVTTKVKAIQARVDAATPESLAAYAAKIKANRAEREQRRDEVAKAIADPQTLEDFRRLMQAKVDGGKALDAARLELTPEQRARFDMLLAEESRGRRSAAAESSKTDVRVAAQTTTGDIIETKHTKTGEDLFVVKAAERVDRDVYNEWNANAKRLGGWYSSFRGNGAVPGFQFKSRENAAAFLQYLGGDTTAAKEAIAERRDAFADDRSQSAVERLNEMADRLEERADESLGRERKANTARRARFAAAAEAAASGDKALARTMRNIADAISAGTTKFLDRVRQKAQVEMLRSTVRTAQYSELQKKYPSYAEQEKHRGEKPTAETADYARWPTFTADRADLARLGRDLLQIDGAKLLGQRILKVADDVTDAYQKFAKENLHKVSVFSTKREGSDEKHMAVFPTADRAEAAIARSGYKGKATTISFKRGEHLVIMGPEMAREAGLWQGDPDKRITLKADVGEEIVAKVKALGKGKVFMPHVFESVAADRARWKALGIETAAEQRATLREFIALQEAPAAPDRIKQLERAMVGRANDGLDFFPTPAETAKAMIDAADIQEGMAVLEPSAGMGHIAEQIRDVSGVDPDVVEFSADRRELLEAKGFHVVGKDFMDMSQRGFTYGDVFRDKDGVEGVMRGSGGMGSNRVGFIPLGKDGREWRDRDDLDGVRKNGSNSGYDRIVMNPPFSNRRDAEHVQHAYSLLKPGGRLVAIMGEGVFYGQDKKAQAFREWLEAVGGTSEKLEEGTFLDPSLPVNTAVNARMVVVDKPAGEAAPADNEGAGNVTGRNDSLSPADTAVYGMVAEGKSAADILKFIASASRNPLNRQLAKLLLKTGIAPQVMAGQSDGWKFNAGNDKKYAAAYNPNTDTISLFRPAAAERNFLHEAMHAATLRALGKKGMAAGQMRALFNHVKKSGQLKGMYGMSDVDEFVAEAFTNPKFQEALKTIDAPASVSGLSSAWHWFVRVVRGILGLPSNQESALSQAIEIGLGVMRENMALTSREAGSKTRYANGNAQSQHRTPLGDATEVEVDGIKRPTLNSNGKPIHWSREGVENFWRWFSPSPSQLLDGLSIAEVSSLKRDTEALADFIESQSSLPESDRFSVIPPSVFAHVSGVVNNRKILDAVVRSLPVYVVNFLSGKKLSAKEVLHDSAMLENMLSVDPASNVSLGVNPSRIAELAVRVIANAGAKISGLANGALKRNSAVLADTNDPVLGAHVRKSSSGDLGIIAGFGDSKVVDAEGRPLVVYHGTAKDFTKFDLSKSGESTGNTGFYGAGAYFSEDGEDAGGYALWARKDEDDAANVIPAYLSLKDPLYLHINPKDDARKDKARASLGRIVDQLLSEGYFGKNPDKNEAGSLYSRLTTFVEKADFERFMGTLYNELKGGEGVSNLARRAGFDGVMAEGFKRGENFLAEAVAFDPTQIKSATGNTGYFGSTNPDIRYNIADEGWSVSEPSKMDDVIYALQDKQIDMKRVVQAIMGAGKKIRDAFNPYLQEELFHGRAAKGVKDFLDFELRPLLAEMNKAGIDMGDFEEYLWNRHAEERNKQIAKINPDMPDGGSGIETSAARAYLAGLPDDKKRAFESLAAKVEAINKNSQRVLVDSGLETQATIDAWNGAYQHYVPLQREDVDSGHVGTGKGFSVRGSASKRAMGSGKKVVDIIANIAMQRERNIVRAEKNRVSNALMGLAMENPNPDFWKVDQAPKERVVINVAIYNVLDSDGNKVADFTNMDEADRMARRLGGEVEQTWGDRVQERIEPGFKNRDNVLLTRVNGKDHYIIFNERDERAMRMATAMKNLDVDNLGRVLSVVGKATRYLSSINTQYNPVFGVINLIRDAQGALINLSSTALAGEQKRVLGYTKDALVGIYRDIRAHRAGKVPSSNWAALFEEFQKEGGQTGYRDQYANAEARAESIKYELEQFKEGKAKQLTRGLFGWLSDYNETMENAVRLAAYKAAKEKGMSKQQAASLAKNITVNFNRKGQMATQVGALYAFFNASVQGTARIAETLFEQHGGDLKNIRLSKKGKQIVLGGIMLGSMQALLLAAAGFGDDEPPDFVKERNLILPIGDGKYLTLAMPLGFHVLPGIGRLATEFVMNGGKDPIKKIAAMGSMFAEAFNPVGNSGFSLQTITPSVVDPFAALAENRDFTGKEIYREDFNKLNPTPGHARAKDVATAWSRVISEALNTITGGSEYRPGLVSWSPDAIDYLIGQATGGVGREVSKMAQTLRSASTGEDLPIYKVPLFGRFVGDTEGQSGQSQKFYDALREINMHEAEYKGLMKEGRRDDARAYMEENPVTRLMLAGSHAENTVRKLRAMKRDLVEGDNDPDKVREIDDRISQAMRSFNERYASLAT